MEDKNLHLFVNGNLYERAKRLAKKRAMSFRALVEEALTQLLKGERAWKKK